MDNNKKSKDKNFEKLKNEFDTMRKLFDNLNSKSKIKPKTDNSDVAKSSEVPKIDKKVTDIFFKEKKLPDLTPEEKLLKKNKKTKAEDASLNFEKNIVKNETETSIVLEFDNEELKIRNKENIVTDKKNLKIETNSPQKELVNTIKETEQTSKIVTKKNKSITSDNTKKEAPKKVKSTDNKAIPIAHDKIKKEIVTPTKKETRKEVKATDNKITHNTSKEKIIIPKETIKEVKQIEPLKGETQESYLSIKEKLEKIKADIKKRESLRDQNTTTQNIISKIAKKQKSTITTTNEKSNKVTNQEVLISKKEDTPNKNTIEQKKKVVITPKEQKNISKPTIETKPVQKKKIVEIKKSNVETKHKKRQEVNSTLKTIKKDGKKSSGVLSIIILVLIIIALLVFWVLFVQ